MHAHEIGWILDDTLPCCMV